MRPKCCIDATFCNRRACRYLERATLGGALFLGLLSGNSCGTRPNRTRPSDEGGWVLAEERGLLSFVWSSHGVGRVAIGARCWTERCPLRGEIGVAEVRILHPESGRRYRFVARPSLERTVLLSPGEVVADSRARFLFVGHVPGQAGLRLWAEEITSEGSK